MILQSYYYTRTACTIIKDYGLEGEGIEVFLIKIIFMENIETKIQFVLAHLLTVPVV